MISDEPRVELQANLFFLVLLRLETRPSCTLGKHSITELWPQPFLL